MEQSPPEHAGEVRADPAERRVPVEQPEPIELGKHGAIGQREGVEQASPSGEGIGGIQANSARSLSRR